MVTGPIRWSLPMAMVIACLLASQVNAARITGTATYRERVALTREAVFEATLEEESQPGTPGRVLSRVRTENPGQVPIAFDLRFDPRRIDARMTYVVRASIYEAGELRFTNQES